jgi:hypothetical protein
MMSIILIFITTPGNRLNHQFTIPQLLPQIDMPPFSTDQSQAANQGEEPFVEGAVEL